MEHLSIGQKCFVVNLSREPGSYLGIVKNVTNKQYAIEIFLKNSISEIRNFDIISGKELGTNPQFKISIRKPVITDPESIKELIKKQNEIKVPTLSKPIKQISNIEILKKNLISDQNKTDDSKFKKITDVFKNLEEIKVEENIEKPKKPRKKKTTKKKTTKTVEESTQPTE